MSSLDRVARNRRLRQEHDRRLRKASRTVTIRVYPINRPPAAGYFELTENIIKPDGTVKGQLTSNGQTITVPGRNVAYILESVTRDGSPVAGFDPDRDHDTVHTAV